MYVHNRNGFLTIRFRWCHFYRTLQLVFRFLTIEMPKYIDCTYLSTKRERLCLAIFHVRMQWHNEVSFNNRTATQVRVIQKRGHMQISCVGELHATFSSFNIERKPYCFFSRENLFLLLFTLIYISCIFCRIFIFILLTNAK